MISKSRSSSIDIRQTREMNLECFFRTQQFLLQQWNTDSEVPNIAAMHLWNSIISSVTESYGIVGQMLTSEVLTTQGRKPFHELKKELRGRTCRKDILLQFQDEISKLHVYKTKLYQIKLHFSSTRRDSHLESQSTMCNYFTWKWRDFSALNNSFREKDVDYTHAQLSRAFVITTKIIL